MTTMSPPTQLLDCGFATELPVELLCDIEIDLEDPHVFQTSVGTRLTYITKHGVLDGPRIRGDLLGGGGDWVILGTDGISRLDVRGTVRTYDGVLIHHETRGVVKFPPNGRDPIAAAGRIPFEASYIRTTPRFETFDKRYAWLTEQVLIGVNEFSAGYIDHRIHWVL